MEFYESPVARWWGCGSFERPACLWENAVEAFYSISNTAWWERQEKNKSQPRCFMSMVAMGLVLVFRRRLSSSREAKASSETWPIDTTATRSPLVADGTRGGDGRFACIGKNRCRLRLAIQSTTRHDCHGYHAYRGE